MKVIAMHSMQENDIQRGVIPIDPENSTDGIDIKELSRIEIEKNM